MANVLITGGSGYLGGTFLQQLKDTTDLPPHGKIYALVRNQEQADKTKKFYNAEPIQFDCDSQVSVTEALVSRDISVVFFMIDSRNSRMQILFIKALAEVKSKTGNEVHFLHATGAKLFSSHAGYPTDREFSDMDPSLYDMQKTSKAKFTWMKDGSDTNSKVIDTAEQFGVRSYIFAPCVVYGKGTGFGNPVSIQTVAIFTAARKLRRVYKVDEGRPIWPVCHVEDNGNLYLQILRKILAHEDIGYGKNGYYLASPGSVAWEDIYEAMAQGMAKRGLINDAKVLAADDKALEKMGEALGCEKDLVVMQLGGKCTLTAERGRAIGWVPQYQPEHILETADAEVELILQSRPT